MNTGYNTVNFKTNGAGVISTCPALTNRKVELSMAAPDSTPGFKVCRKCNRDLPATSEFFGAHKRVKSGLTSRCRFCETKRKRELQRKRRLNPDTVKKERAYNAAWCKANPDKLRASIAASRKAHPETRRAAQQRRRAIIRALPCQWSAQDERRAIAYFGGLCAYCGKQSDSLFATNNLDHFIPLTDTANCPGTVPTNMVPACQHCNNNKRAADPLKWLTRKYGARKAKEIARRIAEYFEWVKVQP